MRPVTVLVPTRTTLLVAFFVLAAFAISYLSGRNQGVQQREVIYRDCSDTAEHLPDCPPLPWVEVLAVWDDGATRFSMLRSDGRWMGGPVGGYVVSWTLPPEGVVGKLTQTYGRNRR